jgi:hypothetical protein
VRRLTTRVFSAVAARTRRARRQTAQIADTVRRKSDDGPAAREGERVQIRDDNAGCRA